MDLPHFPTLCLAPTAGTAGLHPGPSCLQNHGMAKACLGWSRRGVLQLSWFHVNPPYFKQQDFSEGVAFIFPLHSKGSHFSPVRSMWVTISSLGNIWESWLQARSAFPYFAVRSPSAQSRASRSFCPRCLVTWRMAQVQVNLTNVITSTPAPQPKPSLGSPR